MSTRGRIGLQLDANNIESIYMHYASFLGWAGKILLEHYTYRNEVEALIGLGDLSSLQQSLYPDSTQPHHMDKPQQGVCRFYNRDRAPGAADSQVFGSVTHNFYEWPDTSQEYEYLYTLKGDWVFRPPTDIGDDWYYLDRAIVLGKELVPGAWVLATIPTQAPKGLSPFSRSDRVEQVPKRVEQVPKQETPYVLRRRPVWTKD